MGSRSNVNRFLTWGACPRRKKQHAAVLLNKNLTSHVNESELSALEEIKTFRADAARGDYLSMDMPDLQFSAQEMSRGMSKTNEEGRVQVVRMAKYLKDSQENRRMKQEFKFETLDTVLTTQIGQVADPAGRARQVELCRPTLGRQALTRDQYWESSTGVDAPHGHTGVVAAECNTKSRIGHAEGHRRGERRGHTHEEREIRGARDPLGRNGSHQDNETSDGRRVDGCT